MLPDYIGEAGFPDGGRLVLSIPGLGHFVIVMD